MHYTERAMSSSLWVNFFSYIQISFIKWSVLIMYLIAMVTLYCLTILSFPGWFYNYESMININNWFATTYRTFNIFADSIWLPLNFSSTIITIIAVKKILKITKTLS